jgi:hypothetical protein
MNDQELLKDWLDECRTQSTRSIYAHMIGIFQEWYGKPLSSFLSLEPKEMRHIAIAFQNQAVEGWRPKCRIENKTFKGEPLKPNSIISVLCALQSFCACYDRPIKLKGKRLHTMMDLDSHTFSNGDFTKMFNVADVEEKAWLATHTSLGWEVSSILALKRKTVQNLIFKAQENRQKFVYFMDQRQKTGALRLGVLNPLALEWLAEWLKVSPAKIERSKNVYKKQVHVWNSDMLWSYMTEAGVVGLLERLCKEAHVTVTGYVNTHSVRKWVMSGLSRSGFNEWQTKFLMGKAIPVSDMTYLQTLQQEVEERYPKAYESYFDISGKTTMAISSEEREVLELLSNREMFDRLKAILESPKELIGQK